jgi:histone H3/H4
MPRIKAPPAKRNLYSVPRATFVRLVREIAGDFKSDLRWTADALTALQGESELFVEEHFARARDLSDRFKHSTVTLRHFEKKAPQHQPVATLAPA